MSDGDYMNKVRSLTRYLRAVPREESTAEGSGTNLGPRKKDDRRLKLTKSTDFQYFIPHHTVGIRT